MTDPTGAVGDAQGVWGVGPNPIRPTFYRSTQICGECGLHVSECSARALAGERYAAQRGLKAHWRVLSSIFEAGWIAGRAFAAGAGAVADDGQPATNHTSAGAAKPNDAAQANSQNT